MKLSNALPMIGIGLAGLTACGDSDDEPASLSVSNQALQEATVVEIDRIVATAPGFVAIVQSVDGQASIPPIGLRAVNAGESTNLTVALERAAFSGETLVATLHEDSNSDGEFGFPLDQSIDPAVLVDGSSVAATFTVTSTHGSGPVVLADDQRVAENSNDEPQVTVKSVVTSTAGFVTIEAQVSTSNPLLYGVAPVPVGLTAVLDVALTSTTASPSPGDGLVATLYEDENDNGTFEPGVDSPVVVDGSTVSATFTVIAPPANP